MKLSDLVCKEVICGKVVYVFEKHNFALFPWSEVAIGTGEPLRLLTLDYHTDTMPAFRRYASRLFGGNGEFKEKITEERERQLALLLRSGSKDIEAAVRMLAHDEHIDAALRAGILDVAFVIADSDTGHIISNEQKRLNQSPPTRSVEIDGEEVTISLSPLLADPPFTYSIPDSKIVVLEMRNDYPWQTYEGYSRGYKDNVIESGFLSDRLELIQQICSTGGISGLFDKPFVLDIDLDYFNTRKSIDPKDCTVFYELIRRSAAITIARESDCVQSCQLDGEGLTSEFLEGVLKRHIKKAMEL